MNFPHPLMAPIVELALQAGEAILPFWRSGTDVLTKADDSPVTAADLAAHHLIVAGLTALDPSSPVVAERASASFAGGSSVGWAGSRAGSISASAGPCGATTRPVAGSRVSITSPPKAAAQRPSMNS